MRKKKKKNQVYNEKIIIKDIFFCTEIILFFCVFLCCLLSVLRKKLMIVTHYCLTQHPKSREKKHVDKSGIHPKKKMDNLVLGHKTVKWQKKLEKKSKPLNEIKIVKKDIFMYGKTGCSIFINENNLVSTVLFLFLYSN